MYGRELDLDVHVVPAAGHLAREDGYGPWPAAEEWALTGRFDRLLLLEKGLVVGDGAPSALKDRLGSLFGVELGPDGHWQISPR